MLEIQVLAWDSYKNVMGSKQCSFMLMRCLIYLEFFHEICNYGSQTMDIYREQDMLHHMATMLVCYGSHFESKMVAKIKKSSDWANFGFQVDYDVAN